ncbi:MAG TPA: ATP-binding protein [Elusimicrobiota bacterium]|jgi:PAS domain S-box-containing protein|nr:ATP-binding protein [Elusimicrobiota bacterium]
MPTANSGRKSAPASAAPAAGLKVNILLVDDHEENLLALETVLEGLGDNLVRARSGKDALKRLLEEDFAVILLDVQMPEMDGFETAALIRERERSKHTPIIFLTAVSKGEMQVARGYTLGAVDYIFKPFVPEVLQAKVSVFVDLFKKTEQVRAQAQRLRDVEGREHRRELGQVRAQRNRFFHLSVDMMCILGFDGRLKELNAAWGPGLGRFPGELGGTRLADLVHPEDRGRSALFWEALKSGAPSAPLENRLLHADGSYRWLSWSVVAAVREGVFYAAARDITERKRDEERLREMNETLEQKVRERTRELERSNSDLEQFAFLASHDLREPLRKIAGFTQLLQNRYKGRLDETADTYLGYVVSGVCRMEDLISDLLEYSRVGRGDAPPQPTDCGAAVDKAVSNLAVAIEEAGASVTRGSMPTLPAQATELVSLFQNLVSNAVKFRGDAPPIVRISSRRVEEGWEFEVKDNGIGIDPVHHERVFAIFKRLHARDKYPGTGIGLAICKKIVERRGGRIWIESEPGRGSAFRFVLPGSAEPGADGAAP